MCSLHSWVFSSMLTSNVSSCSGCYHDITNVTCWWYAEFMWIYFLRIVLVYDSADDLVAPVNGDFLNQAELDLDSSGYPKLPSSMLGGVSLLLNLLTFLRDAFPSFLLSLNPTFCLVFLLGLSFSCFLWVLYLAYSNLLVIKGFVVVVVF